MRNAIVVGIVLLVTGVNSWMSLDLWRDRRRAPVPRPEAKPTASSPTPAIRPNRIFRPETKTAPETRPPWSELESDDYFQYAANLRAVGCPENTVRDIIVADVAKTLKARRRELDDRSGDSFWLTADQREEIELERQRKKRELKLAKWEMMRELFGYPVDEQTLGIIRGDGIGQLGIWMVGGFLEREKIVPLVGLLGYYTTRAEAVEQQAFGILIDEDYATARDLRDGLEREVTTLIGGAAVEEMYLRILLGKDDDSGVLRYGLNLSGTEFRNIVKIKAAAVDIFTMLFFQMGFEDMIEEEVSEEQIETAIARYLGTERYEDYSRSKDDRYQDIHTFAVGKGLAKREAIAVFNARDRAETELADIKADDSLSAEDQVLLQAAVKTRLESEIRKRFGKIIAEDYLKDGAGSWVEELIQAPQPVPEQ